MARKKKEYIGTIDKTTDGKFSVTIDMKAYKKYCDEMDKQWEQVKKYLEDIGELDHEKE